MKWFYFKSVKQNNRSKQKNTFKFVSQDIHSNAIKKLIRNAKCSRVQYKYLFSMEETFKNKYKLHYMY
jgi:hypothetical protein